MMFSRLFKEMVSARNRLLFLSGEFSRTLPCGVVLTGILCVLLPAFLLPDAGLAVILIPPLASLAALWCFGPRDAAFKFALPCLLAMFSLIWHTERYERDPVAAFAQERPRIGAIGELTVIDPSVCGPRLRWMPVPGNILCRLDRAKYSSYGVWHKIDGLVMVRLPKEHPPLVYGGKFLAEGVLEQPEPPLFPGAFDYGEYLKNCGIRYLFRLTGTSGNDRTETGFMSGLLSVRDFLLGRILSPVASEPDKTLCAAMLFGCRQGIEYQTRLDFIRSGTIHILTVSGLHIGMFAGVMFLLLAFLPFRMRCVIVPLLTALYALSTGLQMPAFRALAMLCTWCFMRAFLLRGSVLNSVFMACAILLIWNPRQLMDPGFQYSFTAVIFLVASLPLTSEWTSMLFEKMALGSRGSYSAYEILAPALRANAFRIPVRLYHCMAGKFRTDLDLPGNHGSVLRADEPADSAAFLALLLRVLPRFPDRISDSAVSCVQRLYPESAVRRNQRDLLLFFRTR